MAELLCARIKRLRRERGLKMKQVAGAVGVSVQVINHWENGERRLYAGHAPALADMLGVTLDALLRDAIHVERVGTRHVVEAR